MTGQAQTQAHTSGFRLLDDDTEEDTSNITIIFYTRQYLHMSELII